MVQGPFLGIVVEVVWDRLTRLMYVAGQPSLTFFFIAPEAPRKGRRWASMGTGEGFVTRRMDGLHFHHGGSAQDLLLL